MGLTIQAGNIGSAGLESNQEKVQSAGGRQNAAANKGRNSVFGGDLKLANDPIAERRKKAQEQAWGTVSSAWAADQAVDQSIEERKSHYAQMEQLKKESTDALKDINQDIKAVKELYEVADDSQEQKDLELLCKRQDYQMKVSYEPLTKDELERLEEIDKKPMTEYQEYALELDKRAGQHKIAIRDAEYQMESDIAGIHGINLERLKTHGMVDAQKEAEAIQAAANDEIIGMLVKEATDHIDEKLEEAEEKAEESAEKKEEQEEKLEEIEEEHAMQEALIAGTKEAIEEAEAKRKQHETPDIKIGDMVDITKGNSAAGDIQQSLEELKNNLKLLEADLKGIKVDEEV